MNSTIGTIYFIDQIIHLNIPFIFILKVNRTGQVFILKLKKRPINNLMINYY